MAKLSDNLGVVFTYWNGSIAELLVAVVDKFGWCVINQYLWVLSFGVNKLENSGTWLWFM